MEKLNKNTETPNANDNACPNYKEHLYTVHVICWDGVEYIRGATKDEIDMQQKSGYVKEDVYSGEITFDFS